MREVLLLGVLIAGLWGTEGYTSTRPPETEAAVRGRVSATDCRALAQELRSFRKAQTSLIRGFVQKNETLAETLDLYSSQFQRRKGGALKKQDFASLRQSADAFRAHGQREANLVGRFETSADALLDQVAQCLESTGSSVSLAPVHQ